MTGRFGRFSEGASRVFQYAFEFAAQSAADISPEHMFLGILRADPELVGSVLPTAGAIFASALGQESLGGAPPSDADNPPSLSTATQRVIELAVDEARRRGDDQVSQRHLLVALARQGDESQRGPLHAQGLTADSIREKVMDFEGPSRGAASRTASSPAPSARPAPAATARVDKFTERARKVLELAQDEAGRFNHTHIGTEHLLLGLVREGEGVAARVLATLGVDLVDVRSSVEFLVGRGETVAGTTGLTPRAKKVIELAVEEARRLSHNYIGTEHLLLGLVREGQGVAAGVLESKGVSLDQIRSQVEYVLGQSSSPSSPPSAPTPTAEPSQPTLAQLDDLVSALPELSGEAAYGDFVHGPGYTCGIVRFLPRDAPDASQITHTNQDVVCHVLSGAGRLRTLSEVHELKPGTICHIPAGTRHDFVAVGGPMVMFVATIDVPTTNA